MLLHNSVDLRLHRLDLILQFCQFLHIVRVFIDIVLWCWLVRSAHRLLSLIFVANHTRTFLDVRGPVTLGGPISKVGQGTFEYIDPQNNLLQVRLVLGLPKLAEFVILAALQLSFRGLYHEFVLDDIANRLHLNDL